MEKKKYEVLITRTDGSFSVINVRGYSEDQAVYNAKNLVNKIEHLSYTVDRVTEVKEFRN